MSHFLAIPPDISRVFVVGDIHGCITELTALLEYLSLEIKPTDAIVFLGDYIDRGPNSFEVIESLLHIKQVMQNSFFLLGNHEEMFLKFLDEERYLGSKYLNVGGEITIKSYGLKIPELLEDINCLPSKHLEFLRSLKLGFKWREYALVHAGIRPGIPIVEQAAKDLVWIREEFTEFPSRVPETIVFGHTVQRKILFVPKDKIGIDTGCVFGNKLSCIELTSGTVFQVKSQSKKVIVSSLW